MPVTKTAKRALRGSKVKMEVNKTLIRRLEIAVRAAKKTKTINKVADAVSLADRAAKKGVIHKNKAGRLKSQLSRLLIQKTPLKKTAKKASKK